MSCRWGLLLRLLLLLLSTIVALTLNLLREVELRSMFIRITIVIGVVCNFVYILLALRWLNHMNIIRRQGLSHANLLSVETLRRDRILDELCWISTFHRALDTIHIHQIVESRFTSPLNRIINSTTTGFVSRFMRGWENSVSWLVLFTIIMLFHIFVQKARCWGRGN